MSNIFNKPSIPFGATVVMNIILLAYAYSALIPLNKLDVFVSICGISLSIVSLVLVTNPPKWLTSVTETCIVRGRNSKELENKINSALKGKLKNKTIISIQVINASGHTSIKNKEAFITFK